MAWKVGAVYPHSLGAECTYMCGADSNQKHLLRSVLTCSTDDQCPISFFDAYVATSHKTALTSSSLPTKLTIGGSRMAIRPERWSQFQKAFSSNLVSFTQCLDDSYRRVLRNELFIRLTTDSLNIVTASARANLQCPIRCQPLR